MPLCRVLLSAIALAGCVLIGLSAAVADECLCNGDLNDDGTINWADALIFRNCLEDEENCSACTNSCDIDCSGVVDDWDWEALRCLKTAPDSPECCACPCNGDVNCDGELTAADALIVQDCMDGDCSGCNYSCDLNRDGVCNQRDFCGVSCLIAGYPAEVCCSCTCCADADGDGAVTFIDCHIVARCVFGNCSACAGEACDLNCDGDVNIADMDACWCLLEGDPEAECCWGWPFDPPSPPSHQFSPQLLPVSVLGPRR